MDELVEFNQKRYDTYLRKTIDACKDYQARLGKLDQAKKKIAKQLSQVKEWGKLTVFVKQINEVLKKPIPYSTFTSWLQDYENFNVGEEVIAEVAKAKGKKVDKAALNRAKKKVKKKSDPKELKRIYVAETKKSSEDITLEYIVKELGRFKFEVCSKMDKAAVDQDNLKAVMLLAEEITKNLGFHFAGYKNVRSRKEIPTVVQ